MNDSLLTPYEASVVQQISSWKAQKPGFYARLTTGMTKPFTWAIKQVIPEVIARKAIEAAYATSDWLSSPNEVIKTAGVKSLEELQSKSLELSDKLADIVSSGSQKLAAADGAITGAGGLTLAAADVGALAVLALRAIQRTGNCYGYALDQPRDRAWVLGILLIVGTNSPTERLEFLGKLQNVENWAISKTVEALAMERLAQQLVQIASMEAIPGLGAFIGTGTNLLFIRQILKAARCIFQERWLRENNKIESIVAR